METTTYFKNALRIGVFYLAIDKYINNKDAAG